MKSESIHELATALAKAQQEIKSAIRDNSNPFYKSKYADLHSVWLACREALNKNGLSVVQTLSADSLLITDLLHTSGQWISGACPLINTKQDMQGLGSAITYARRYSLAAICGVATEDDDAQAAVEKPHDAAWKPNVFSDKKDSTIQMKIQSGNEGGKAEYIIPLKKFAGKKLSEVQSFELLNYMTWIKKEGITKPDYLEFIMQVENYLKAQRVKEKQEDLNLSWPESK